MNALTEDDLRWLALNASADPAALMLKHHGDGRFPWLALQLACRRKARGKIAPALIDRLIYPNTLAVEQCTSTAIAEEHAELLKSARNVLDMTCGLGCDTFALAGGGARVIACDLREENVEAARLNVAALGLENVTVHHADSVELLAGLGPGEVDTIIIDPARRGDGGRRLYSLSDCSPDVCAILPSAASRASRMFVKASPMLDIAATLKLLGGYHADIHIWGTRTECKELCIDINFGAGSDAPADRHIVSCHTVDEPTFSFILEQERDAPCTYAAVSPGDTLYEPYPAVVKGGGWRTLSATTGLSVVSALSHLYIGSGNGDHPFPGSAWTVEAVLPWGKEAIRSVQRQWPRISVASRGFMLDAEALRKRLKTSEAPGDMKLWGVTAADGAHALIIGRRKV